MGKKVVPKSLQPSPKQSRLINTTADKTKNMDKKLHIYLRELNTHSWECSHSYNRLRNPSFVLLVSSFLPHYQVGVTGPDTHTVSCFLCVLLCCSNPHQGGINGTTTGVNCQAPELGWWGLIKAAEIPALLRVCSLSITQAKRSDSTAARTRMYYTVPAVCVLYKSSLQNKESIFDLVTFCDLPARAKHRKRLNARTHSKHLENLNLHEMNRWKWVFCSHFVIMWHSKTWCHWVQTEPEKHISHTDVTFATQCPRHYSLNLDGTFRSFSFTICFLLSDWFLCDMPDIQFSACNH